MKRHSSKLASLSFWTLIIIMVMGILYLAATSFGFKIGNRASAQTPQYVEIPKFTISGVPEIIVEHTGYTVSFNSERNIPNWVAYELTKEEVGGDEPRSQHFLPDPEIRNCPTTDDYKNSGYDRGHMAPAGDMKWSEQAMKESFYLSNICPQNHNLNNGDWKILEEHLRKMATLYDTVYIVCGPVISANPKTIGAEHTVTVPNAFFKAALRKDKGSWSAIGFLFANQAGHKALSTYAMSIEDLQIVTDLDFFYNLPDEIEEKVEATYSLRDWGL